jgi:hypothetical protein
MLEVFIMAGIAVKKKKVATKKKKVVNKKVAKKPKKPGMPKAEKKRKKGGWPKGKKRGKRVRRPKSIKKAKRPGRPRKKGSRGKTSNSITIPVDRNSDIDFWSDLVVYLNKNNRKAFHIQLDGINYSLHAS